jgi:hypothetical protein
MRMKLLAYLLLSFFLVSFAPAQAQRSKHKPVKQAKRGWRKSGTSYNPYLKKKAKNKPSAVMARQDKKELQRQKKAAKKQMRRSKRSLNK